MSHPIHIIGAGLIGLSTADSLMERGRKVVVWDKAPAPGMGANYINGAVLHPSQAAPWIVGGWNDDLEAPERERLTREGLELSARSTERLSRRMRELGLPEDRRGVVQVFGSETGRDLRLEAYARMGVRASAARWMGHPAVDIHEDTTSDANAYALRLAEDLAERGAEFRMGLPIHLTRETGGAFRIHSGERGAGEETGAEELVVAAGHATTGLLRPLGLELDIEALPGHGLRFRRAADLPPVTVLDAESRTALTVLDDEVRLSGGVGLDTPDDLLPIWREIAGEIVEVLGQPIRRWTGHRPASRSGPRMGATPIEGLYVNAGHGHMGWTLSAGAGEIVADTVQGARQ